MPGSGMWLVLLSGGVGIGLLATIRFWLRLRFLRHVYDHGGARDLLTAGSALQLRSPQSEGSGDLG